MIFPKQCSLGIFVFFDAGVDGFNFPALFSIMEVLQLREDDMFVAILFKVEIVACRLWTSFPFFRLLEQHYCHFQQCQHVPTLLLHSNFSFRATCKQKVEFRVRASKSSRQANYYKHTYRMMARQGAISATCFLVPAGQGIFVLSFFYSSQVARSSACIKREKSMKRHDCSCDGIILVLFDLKRCES